MRRRGRRRVSPRLCAASRGSGLHGLAGDAGGFLGNGAVELVQGHVGEQAVQKIQRGRQPHGIGGDQELGEDIDNGIGGVVGLDGVGFAAAEEAEACQGNRGVAIPALLAAPGGAVGVPLPVPLADDGLIPVNDGDLIAKGLLPELYMSGLSHAAVGGEGIAVGSVRNDRAVEQHTAQRGNAAADGAVNADALHIVLPYVRRILLLLLGQFSVGDRNGQVGGGLGQGSRKQVILALMDHVLVTGVNQNVKIRQADGKIGHGMLLFYVSVKYHRADTP